MKTLEIKDKIIIIRDQRVILDIDVAKLYNVETREVNQALRNNSDKFPDGYVFELTKEEKGEVIKIFDNPAAIKFSPTLPKAFTEKGLYMLATILKSPRATETTIAIIETFAKVRELSRAVAELNSQPQDEKAQKALMTKGGEILSDLLTNDMKTTGTETTLEINLALLKITHSVKKEPK